MGLAFELVKVKKRTPLAFFKNTPDLPVSSLKTELNFGRAADEVCTKLNTNFLQEQCQPAFWQLNKKKTGFVTFLNFCFILVKHFSPQIHNNFNVLACFIVFRIEKLVSDSILK